MRETEARVTLKRKRRRQHRKNRSISASEVWPQEPAPIVGSLLVV